MSSRRRAGEPAPAAPVPGERGAHHRQKAALALPGCSHGDLKPAPSKSRMVLGDHPCGCQSKLVTRPPWGTSEDTGKP